MPFWTRDGVMKVEEGNATYIGEEMPETQWVQSEYTFVRFVF